MEWDGRDDHGRPVENHPLHVRVGLELRPTFDRMLEGTNPAWVGRVRGLATGSDGTLYVLHCYGGHHHRDNSAAIATFDRDGRYLKTIAPFPAALPDERLEGLRTIRRADGERVPYVYQYETRSFLPGLGDLPKHGMVVTRAGELGFVGIQEGPKNYAQPGEARFTVIGVDGGVPAGAGLQTLIHPLTDSGASLALSPDEQTVYATGVRAGLHPAIPANEFTCPVCDGGGGRTWRHTVPVPMVFRFERGAEQVSVFLDGSGPASDERPNLTHPMDVATDRDGNVYVADFGADQVWIHDANGTYLDRIAIDQPFRVAVHRGNGAIYVLAGDRAVDLVKFERSEAVRELARRRIGDYRHPSPLMRPILALDDTDEPAVLWIDHQRVEEQGDQFGEPASINRINATGTFSMGAVMELSLDRIHRHLYVNNRRRLDIETDTWELFPTQGGRMWPTSTPQSASGTAGRDGKYYLNLGARRARVIRYTSDMTVEDFEISRNEEGHLSGFARNRGRGQTADHLGNVYVLWKKEGPVADEGDFHRAHTLTQYAPDGSPLNKRLVNSQIPSVSSPRVDFQGNVYLVAGLRPGTQMAPEELRGQVPRSLHDPDAVHGLNAYPMIYGSIVKFGPEGGAIFENAGGIAANYAYGEPIDVHGAQWVTPGVSVASSWATPKIGRERTADGQWSTGRQAPGASVVCLCEHANIDVDGFGRVFYPDAGRAQVGVLDTAGNRLGTFGTYGNPDSDGLSFWWPQAVAVDHEAVYVGDRLNRRIVAARLSYRNEKTGTLAHP